MSVSDLAAGGLATALFALAAVFLGFNHILRPKVDAALSERPNPVPAKREAQRTDIAGFRRRYLGWAAGATLVVIVFGVPAAAVLLDTDASQSVSWPKCVFIAVWGGWIYAGAQLWIRFGKTKPNF